MNSKVYVDLQAQKVLHRKLCAQLVVERWTVKSPHWTGPLSIGESLFGPETDQRPKLAIYSLKNTFLQA